MLTGTRQVRFMKYTMSKMEAAKFCVIKKTLYLSNEIQILATREELLVLKESALIPRELHRPWEEINLTLIRILTMITKM